MAQIPSDRLKSLANGGPTSASDRLKKLASSRPSSSPSGNTNRTRSRTSTDKGTTNFSAAGNAEENMRRAVALNGLLLDEYGPVRSNKTGGLRTFSEQRRDEAQRAYADVQNRKKRTMNTGKYLTESAQLGLLEAGSDLESAGRTLYANARYSDTVESDSAPRDAVTAMYDLIAQNSPYALGSSSSQKAVIENATAPNDYTPAWRTFSEEAAEKAEALISRNLVDERNNLSERQQALAEESQYQSHVARGLGQVAGTISNMLPTLAAGAVNPALGMAVLGASAGGGAAQQAIDSGAGIEQATAAGILTGAKEVAIESLFDGLGGLLGGGTVGKALNKAFGTKATLRYAANALGEGAEEVMAAFVQPYLDRMTWDSEAQRASMKDLLNAGAMGTIVSLIFGVPVLFQNGRMTTVESSLSGQAKADSDAFVQQVFDLFNGEKSERELLTVGDTPEILQRHGADSRKIVISPDTVRKSVYPQGYMGLKQGHNLGFGFVGKLNEQLAEPAAILKSTTQPNSLVVFTEMLDGQGRPVMVALHLDKYGRLGISNEIASAYGRNDFNNFIAKERAAGNVLYENKNKSLRDLPEQGYRLEELGAQYDPMLQRQKQNSPADPRHAGVQFPGSSIDEAVSMDSPNGLLHAGVQFPGSSASEAVATTNIAGNGGNVKGKTGKSATPITDYINAEIERRGQQREEQTADTS